MDGGSEKQKEAFVDTANQLTTRTKYLLLMIERTQREDK